MATVLTKTVLPALFFITPIISMAVPRFTVVLLCLLALAAIGSALAEGTRLRELFKLNAALVVFLLAGLYLFINATWSLDIGRAIGKAATFTAFAVLAFGTIRAVAAWPKARLRTIATSFALGVLAGALFLLLQLLTHQAATLALFKNLHFIRPDGTKPLIIHHGHLAGIKAFELNRGVGALTLCLWPALLALVSMRESRWGRGAAIGLFIVGLVVIAVSQHDTSQIALPISAATLLLAWFWPRMTWYGVLAAWCAAFVLVVPISDLAFKAGLHEESWIPYSGRARLILWAYTAKHVPDHPMLGIGISSTRTMDRNPTRRAEVKADQPEDYAAGWWAGPHAHNEYLQTWYELGVVGVVLLMLAGALVIRGIGGLAPPSQPFMLAHYMAFWMISASGWGMWQSWLMALPGLAAIYGAVSTFASQDEPAPGSETVSS